MSTFSQLFPPSPRFTEASIGSLAKKVYVITGATSGVGLELAKYLYSKHATVYVGGRAESRCNEAIEKIKSSHKRSNGSLAPFVVDLSDLGTVKPATAAFLEKESRLDVLFHNAGVMTPPEGSKTKDGYDLELGTNCLGPFLLTRLLEPTLKATVNTPDMAEASVRVVWVSSMVTVSTPEGGVSFDTQGNPVQLKAMNNYMQSKVGDMFLAHEFAQKLGESGVISVSLNPGLMKTELQRNSPPPQRVIMGIVFKGPKYGAYTELYAGLSPEITKKHNGSFYIPWGRRGSIPDHLEKSMKKPSQGEKSVSDRFYDWCEKQVAPFL